MKRNYIITITNAEGLIKARYYKQAEDSRKAIANILVNERPTIEEGDKITTEVLSIN